MLLTMVRLTLFFTIKFWALLIDTSGWTEFLIGMTGCITFLTGTLTPMVLWVSDVMLFSMAFLDFISLVFVLLIPTIVFSMSDPFEVKYTASTTDAATPRKVRMATVQTQQGHLAIMIQVFR